MVAAKGPSWAQSHIVVGAVQHNRVLILVGASSCFCIKDKDAERALPKHLLLCEQAGMAWSAMFCAHASPSYKQGIRMTTARIGGIF